MSPVSSLQQPQRYAGAPYSPAFNPPPPTINILDPKQRARLLRSARKLEALLGTAPYVVDSTESGMTGESQRLQQPALHLPSSSSMTLVNPDENRPRKLRDSPYSSSTSSLVSFWDEEESASSDDHSFVVVQGPFASTTSLVATDADISDYAHPAFDVMEPRTPTAPTSTSSRGSKATSPLTRTLFSFRSLPQSPTDAFDNSPVDEATSPLSLPPPSFSLPQSPVTETEQETLLRRKRLAKLSKTLGEDVPPELVFPSRGVPKRPSIPFEFGGTSSTRTSSSEPVTVVSSPIVRAKSPSPSGSLPSRKPIPLMLTPPSVSKAVETWPSPIVPSPSSSFGARRKHRPRSLSLSSAAALAHGAKSDLKATEELKTPTQASTGMDAKLGHRHVLSTPHAHAHAQAVTVLPPLTPPPFHSLHSLVPSDHSAFPHDDKAESPIRFRSRSPSPSQSHEHHHMSLNRLRHKASMKRLQLLGAVARDEDTASQTAGSSSSCKARRKEKSRERGKKRACEGASMDWGRRKEKGWSGEWNVMDMGEVVRGLRELRVEV